MQLTAILINPGHRSDGPNRTDRARPFHARRFPPMVTDFTNADAWEGGG